MSTALTIRDLPGAIERVVVAGDLSQLKPEERLLYYKAVCESVGLNPLTRPLEYITLNGKLTLYARKDATDQLRAQDNRQVSVTIQARELVEDCYVVTARATLPSGRTDESIGAVSLLNLKGDARCNAMMKAETKAKRRVTLSICGLGMLDETELETIPSAKPASEVTQQPITFTKKAEPQQDGGGARPSGEVRGQPSHSPASAPANSGPDGRQKGVNKQEPSAGAEPSPRVEAAVPASTPVDYITAGQARNLHRDFRREVKQFSPHRYLEADNIFYQWLTDKGLVNEKGEPTAEKIRAQQWFPTKTALMSYAHTL